MAGPVHRPPPVVVLVAMTYGWTHGCRSLSSCMGAACPPTTFTGPTVGLLITALPVVDEVASLSS
jgi:hypothetical protein